MQTKQEFFFFLSSRFQKEKEGFKWGVHPSASLESKICIDLFNLGNAKICYNGLEPSGSVHCSEGSVGNHLSDTKHRAHLPGKGGIPWFFPAVIINHSHVEEVGGSGPSGPDEYTLLLVVWRNDREKNMARNRSRRILPIRTWWINKPR
jgi:hypothetical protein